MASTFHGIETSKRALFVQNTMMQTLGHNVANASTDGYTRQRVSASATRPLYMPGMNSSVAPGQLGTGVQHDSITRVRDSFLDLQYRRENSSLGSWSIQDSSIRSIESFLNEPSANALSGVMDKFWDSWEVLNRDPSLLSARVEVTGAAQNMTDMLKHVGQSLNKLDDDITNNINIKISESNDILNNIANLTSMIQKVEGKGDNANDFRDQRDLLIDKLSTIVNIEVREGIAGDMVINSGGVNILDGDTVTPVSLATVTSATGGELHGYQMSSDAVDHMRTQLNAMLNTLVNGTVEVELPTGYIASQNLTLSNGQGTIPAGTTLTGPTKIQVQGLNGLHALGYTLSDPALTGIPFFTTSTGETNFTIDNIQVNPVIVNDTSKISASGRYDVVNGQKISVKGNSVIAQALAKMRDSVFQFPNAITSLSSGTIDDFYRALTSELGTNSANINRNKLVQQDMVDNVTLRRESVSGVSLDEEMSDMIKFQHAYNAAARNMTTVDEMLDRVINQMGIVGR